MNENWLTCSYLQLVEYLKWTIEIKCNPYCVQCAAWVIKLERVHQRSSCRDRRVRSDWCCAQNRWALCSWTPRHQTPLDESKQFIAATSGGQREPSRKKEMVAAELLMMMIMTMLKIHVAIQLGCGQKCWKCQLKWVTNSVKLWAVMCFCLLKDSLEM